MQFGKKIKIIKKISQDHQQLECAKPIPDSADSTSSISSLNCSSSSEISDSPPSSKVKLSKKISISHSLSTNEIKDYFYEPAKRLIENNGYNEDGVLIADVNGAAVILEILDSILGNKKRCDGNVLGLVDILEKNIEDQLIEETNDEIEEIEEEEEEIEEEEEEIEEEEEEKANLVEKIEQEDDYEEEEEEEDEEDEDEEEEISVYDEGENDDYEDCESYMNNIPDDSMDDY
jgi:hypothetical protein